MVSYIKKREKRFYLIMTLLVAAVIFFSSTIQTTAGEKTGLNLATLYHFSVFFMLIFFLSLTLINKRLDRKTIFIILLISLIYALSDELHQLFVPGRFCSLKDVLIDFIGSLCALLTIKAIEIIKRI
jgi:VanZ family protein